jgi:phage regulator Rha-like protein
MVESVAQLLDQQFHQIWIDIERRRNQIKRCSEERLSFFTEELRKEEFRKEQEELYVIVVFQK